MKKLISNIRTLDFFLSLFIIIYFFWIFFKYTVNIPINDDYAVLDNFNKIIETNSVLEKIKLFFAQHNEHRIVYDRIWFLISYKLNNQINFNLLSFIGNLSLLGIFFLFMKKLLIFKNYLVLFPVSVFILNFSFHENITFSMATLSNLTVVFFSLLSLSFLTSKTLTDKRFLFAVIFCLFAMYTQGSGLFVVPVSLLILFLQKDFRRLKFYAIIGVIFFAIYFIGYEKPLNSPSIIESVIHFKMRTVLYIIVFLGNAFSFDLIFSATTIDSLILSSVVGFVFLSIYIFSFKNKYYDKNPFVFSIMTHVIVISIVTGLTRSQIGIETAISSRYRILSALFLICILIRVIEYFKEKETSVLKVNCVILVLTIFYFLNFSFIQEEYFYFRTQKSLKGVLNYYSGNHKLLNGFEQDFYKTVIENSIKNETYFFPSKKELEKIIIFSSKKEIDYNGLDSNLAHVNIDEITNLFDSYYIEGWAYIEDQKTISQAVYIVITNQNTTTFYNAQSVNRYDLNPYFKKNNLEQGGFYARIKSENLRPGVNKISVYIENDGIKKLAQTDKIIIK
jgi:hypothetical protein